MVEFEFKRRYKSPRASQCITLGHLSIKRLSRPQSVESRVIIEPPSSRETKYYVEMMTATKDGLGSEEGIVGEAAQTPMVQDVPESTGVITKILKSS